MRRHFQLAFPLAALATSVVAACGSAAPGQRDLGTAVASTLTALPSPTLEPTAYPTKPVFTGSYSIVLEPGVPGTITYADDLGFRTTLDFPLETASTSTTVTLIPELATEPPPGAALTGHAFVVLVLPDGQLSKGFVFPSPVLITLMYEQTFVPEGARLELLWWSGNEWIDPAEACTPPHATALDLQQNLLRSSTCYPGAFGLFSMVAN